MAAGADRSSMLAKLAKGFSVQGRNAMSKKGTFDAFDESTWTDGERRYFKIIDDALANGDDMQISNGKPQHAVYLLAKFLENASHSINMFSGRLSRYLDDGSVPAFADPHVLASACGFLERDATLRVVLEGEPDVGPGTQDPERHPLVQVARELAGTGRLRGSLDVRKVKDRALEALHQAKFDHHWMVMDGSAYRLELEPATTKAFANFGDAEYAEELEELFTVLHQRSSPLVSISG